MIIKNVHRYFFVFIIILIFSQNLLAQSNGWLKLKVNTDGAKILVNNILEEDNTTAGEEFIIELYPGSYTIKAIKEGSFDEIRQVTITKNEVTKLNIEFKSVSDIDLKQGDTGTIVQGYGKLTVKSNPYGATIYVGGRAYTKTPDTFDKVRTGSILVEVVKDGRREKKLVNIVKDKTTVVEFDLSPKYGTLTVYSDPNKANAYIDRQFMDTTPFSKKLLVGNYGLQISKNLWDDDVLQISIQNNKTTLVKSFLKKPIISSEITPEYIGRTKKNEISSTQINSLLKEEYRVEYKRPGWALPTLIASCIAIPAGIIAITNGKDTDGDGSADQWTTSQNILGYGMVAGIIALPVSIGAMLRKDKQKIPIEKNIAYNKRKLFEIEKKNKEIRNYNSETERLLKYERGKIIKENRQFNQKRKTLITIE